MPIDRYYRRNHYNCTYPFVRDLCVVDLKPTGTHDLALDDKELECTGTRAKYPGDVGTSQTTGHRGFYGWLDDYFREAIANLKKDIRLSSTRFPE